MKTRKRSRAKSEKRARLGGEKNTKFMVDVVLGLLAASAAGAVLLGVLALLMWMKTSVVR
jgi:hypothetical protein